MNSILLHVMPAEVLELTPSEIQRVFVDKMSERAARLCKIAPKWPKSAEFQGELQRSADVFKVG